MKLYYYFSVNDRFFTECTEKFSKENDNFQFSGLALGRKEFLNTSLYSSVSYISEFEYDNTNKIDYLYLKEVEGNYNITISELINADRVLIKMGKLEAVKYAQEIIRAIESDYKKNDFNVIFSSGLADFPSYFLFHFAKKKGISFYYFVYSRMGGTVFLTDREDTGPKGLEVFFKENIADYNLNPSSFVATKKFIENYKNNKSQPYYVTLSSANYRRFSMIDIKVMIAAYKGYKKDKNSYGGAENPLILPLNRLKKIRQRNAYQQFFKDKFLKQDELGSRKYFIYPLHFHPEAATLIQGRWLNNQKVIIEMIAKALPIDTILVVKEHRVSIGRRPLEFYKEIDFLHNVYFVSEQTEVYQLLQNSIGVVTISSSMGLEAVMLNKPVISFGDIHYNILSQVIKARDISKMHDYVTEALNFESYNEAEYWAFFKAITQNCYNLAGYSPHDYSPEHIDTFLLMLKDINENYNVD